MTGKGDFEVWQKCRALWMSGRWDIGTELWREARKEGKSLHFIFWVMGQ